MSKSPASGCRTLVLFSDYSGDWDRYLDALYTWFKQDFIATATALFMSG